MQGWYWDYPKTADGKSWADTLRLKAASLKQAGITHVWFPPHAVSSSGTGSNGYNPKDLFIGDQTTGLGTRPALNNMLAAFTTQGIAPVADVIFNHRDGGQAENNPSVKDYITNYYIAAKQPFPSDRFRCALPLGGTTGNGAGDYYFKISSKTGDGRFNNYGYKVYLETKTKGWQNLPDVNEAEPNGGGDCSQPNNDIELGRNLFATLETTSGCGTDEFHLNLKSADFNPAGDTLFVYLTNTGGYSDHRIYGIWSSARSTDIVNDLQYQTYTNFSGLPSGRGQMNYEFFKPNSANAATTYLSGDWDAMDFFYDYDQFQPQTKDTLISYAKWNWTDLGVRGFRMDAVKHFSPQFVGDLLNALHHAGMDPSLVVGEWYSTSAFELKGWVNDVYSNMEPGTKDAIQPKIFDFALREQLRQACDDGSFDVRNVFTGSLRDQGLSGYNVVTFVNNHDFRDATGFASLIHNNPILAYAYILTNNQLGVPTIFYPDYYGYATAEGGKYAYYPSNLPAYETEINRLLQVLKTYLNGAPAVEYLNRLATPFSANFIEGQSSRALIYQLQGFAGNGNKEVIVAINFSNTALKVDQEINTRGGAVAQGTRFTDVLANSAFPYALVSSSNQVYIELPPHSYSVWVQGTEAVLPLTLVNFRAVATAKKTVNLTWRVTDNEDADYFVIERADDGVHFTKIGVLAANKSAGMVDYSFTDPAPIENTGMLYRLQLNSKSGRKTYSNLELVRVANNQTNIRLLQNPVSTVVELLADVATGATVQATVFNAAGQQIMQKSLPLAAGVSKLQIPVDHLSSGVYQIQVTANSFSKVFQFIKK